MHKYFSIDLHKEKIPKQVKKDVATDDSVTLTWLAVPLMDEDDVYQVSYRSENERDWVVYGPTTRKTMLLVDSLAQDTGYEFRVRLVDMGTQRKYRYGPPSNIIRTMKVNIM